MEHLRSSPGRTCEVEGCGRKHYGRGLCKRHWQRNERGSKRIYGDDLQRWLSYVDKSGDCWSWTGARDGKGYAVFRLGEGKVRAHRWSYERHVGPIRAGLQVDHTCHNSDESCPGGVDCPHRRCVNPAHLEATTGRVNTHRSATTPASVNAQKTHCPQGHEYSEDNTMRQKDGARICRKCHREHGRRSAAKRRAARRLAASPPPAECA